MSNSCCFSMCGFFFWNKTYKYVFFLFCHVYTIWTVTQSALMNQYKCTHSVNDTCSQRSERSRAHKRCDIYLHWRHHSMRVCICMGQITMRNQNNFINDIKKTNRIEIEACKWDKSFLLSDNWSFWTTSLERTKKNTHN